jgi:hypothetical protein
MRSRAGTIAIVIAVVLVVAFLLLNLWYSYLYPVE